jgi:hypothetical protein
MKRIMLFVMLLWILVTVEICTAEPPAQPSPGSSQFGKSVSVETRGATLNQNFLEHYASSKISDADKLILGLTNIILSHIEMGNYNQRLFGEGNNIFVI